MESYSYDIRQRPDFAWLSVSLRANQKLLSEPGAMATMAPGVQYKSSLKRGLFKSLARLLGGESMVMNTYTADENGGEVTLAPPTLGDIRHYAVAPGRELMLQRGGFLACAESVDVTASWQGARGFFSGEGLVLLKAQGEGDLWFNTFGGLIELDVDGETIVDTGYIVAFESSLQYSVGAMPGVSLSKRMKTFIFGGEALVCRFSGKGKVWVQTRAVQPFLRFVWPYRPVQKRNN